jgi:hypothetical protein
MGDEKREGEVRVLGHFGKRCPDIISFFVYFMVITASIVLISIFCKLWF